MISDLHVMHLNSTTTNKKRIGLFSKNQIGAYLYYMFQKGPQVRNHQANQKVQLSFPKKKMSIISSICQISTASRTLAFFVLNIVFKRDQPVCAFGFNAFWLCLLNRSYLHCMHSILCCLVYLFASFVNFVFENLNKTAKKLLKIILLSKKINNKKISKCF